MIPRRLIYCWYGDRAQSELMTRCLESWKRVMPDYEIHRFDLGNTQLDNNYCREAASRQRWSALSNYVRLWALCTEGGIYLDTDVEAIRSLSSLLANRCFAGFQVKAEQGDWVNSAILGAEAGHPFLKACIERLLGAFEQTGGFARSPQLTTKLLRDWGLKSYGLQEIGGVTLYPVEYFYPYSWLEKYRAEKITADTYCIHHWAGTWRTGPRLEWPAPIKRLKKSVAAWLRANAERLQQR